MKTLLSRPNLLPAQQSFANAARYSHEWNALVAKSVKAYGDRPQGGFVSGIYSEHFPEPVRNQLRDLARRVSVETDIGFALRPARVQMRTMRNLKNAVRERDGSGYYG